MSDTDADAGDANSSDFDKEAEREKLREKFAHDDEKRESTRRMSELLLKGATMTNKHCDTCGDPLFRQNGQEFCATCNAGRPNEESAAEKVAADEAPTANGQAESADPVSEQRTTENAADPSTAAAPPTQSDAGEGRRTTPSRAVSDDGGQSPPTGEGASTARSPATPSASSPSPSPSNVGVTGDVDAARDALVAALTRHATAGAETDDPRAARDHLEAAREAAEALSALRR